VNLFGMITTAASRHYTPLALRSFFAHTLLAAGDRVVLVDNDGDFVLPDDIPRDRLQLVRPAAPQSFACNANMLLADARAAGADLFLLNNDLVFPTGWLEPLLADRKALLSPLSNAQVTRSAGTFTTEPAMDLEAFTGHDADLEAIAREHRATCDGYQRVASVAFFCIKIPRTVYEVVGGFDEGFGKGGGEDRDYAVRAWIAGIPQEYALASYVLHFQGRSTWRGAESPEQIEARNAQYHDAFQKKWGAALTYGFLRGNWNLFRTDAQLARLLDTADFTPIVRRLRSRPSLDAFIARQRAARFDAVVCVYDDDSWLSPTIASVYDAVEAIWFLVGEQPWNGAPSDQSALVERIQALPDPARKFQIVRGTWADEAAQRNEGLRLVGEAGADYCFVLDADEIYDTPQLRQAMALVRENPQIDCWRLSCFTYWKSYRYRVDPPEAITAPVFVRVGTGRFLENRMYHAPVHANIPQATLMFHHMSYARTDEQILRKITTFGHAKDVVPGWYEQVWRRWDRDHGLQDLNPCWPGAYHRAIEQPYEALPAVLRALWDSERAAS
jgi:GT2 family glycosyltransferase